MKLDGEPTYHGSSVCDVASKIMRHSDNYLMINMADVENKAVWEGEDDLMSHMHKKDTEYADLSKQSYMGIKESFNGKRNDGTCTEAPFTITADESKLDESETKLCTDKTVTEILPPEMIGCYKECACHNIKDICVDEGICSLEKILVENDESSQKFPSSFNYPVESGNSALSKEMADDAATTVHDLKPMSCGHLISVEKDAVDPTNHSCNNDHKHYSESLSKVGRKSHPANPFLSDISNETIDFKEFLPLQELETDPLQVEPTNFNCIIEHLADHQKFNKGILEEECFTTTAVPSDARQSNQSSGLKEDASICLSQGTLEEGCTTAASSPFDVRESEQSSEIKEIPPKNLSESTLEGWCSVVTTTSLGLNESEESSGIKEKSASSLLLGLLKDVCSADATVPSDAKEPNQSRGIMGNHANAELESGISGAASASGQERKEKIDGQQDGQAKNDTVTEEAVSGNAIDSAGSSFVHNNHGDFSDPVSLSGPIASLGHIPYSGSTSFRSDSNSTSTRSFAFPILQSEWNHSPVRMAKADRRHSRKQWVSRMGRLCCRF